MEPIFPAPDGLDLPGLDFPDMGGAVDPVDIADPIDAVDDPDPGLDDPGLDDPELDDPALDDPALDDAGGADVDLIDPDLPDADIQPDGSLVTDGSDDAVEDRLEELLGGEYDIDGEALAAAMFSGDAAVVATFLTESGVPAEVLELSASSIADFVANGGVVVLPIVPVPTQDTPAPVGDGAGEPVASAPVPSVPAEPVPVAPAPAAEPAVPTPETPATPVVQADVPAEPSLPGPPLDADGPAMHGGEPDSHPAEPSHPTKPSMPVTPSMPDVPVAEDPAAVGVVVDDPSFEPAPPAELPQMGADDAHTSVATVVEVDQAAGVVVLDVAGERIEVPIDDLEAVIDAAQQQAVVVEGRGGIDPVSGEIALAGLGAMLVAATGLRLSRGRGNAARLVSSDRALPPPDPRTRRV